MLGALIKSDLKAEGRDYLETTKSLGRDSWKELKGFVQAGTFGEALKQGAANGLKAGQDLGHLVRLPIGVAITGATLAVGGIPAVALFGCVGGAEVGSKVGQLVGRLNSSEGTPKQQSKQATTGSLLGAVGGGALAFGNPVAGALGEVYVGERVGEGVLAGAGAVVGGALGLTAHAVKVGTLAAAHEIKLGAQALVHCFQNDDKPA